MTRATYTVLFYIKRTKVLKDGTAPIYTRITINRQRSEFSLQKSIEESQWDNKRGCAKGYSKSAKNLNSYIDFVKNELYTHKRKMEEYGKRITAVTLKNTYLGIDEDNKTILEVFKEHNDRCKSLINIDFAPGTYDMYHTCYKYVERFIQFKYHKDDMMLFQVTQSFVKDFEFYQKTQRKCAHNTAIKYLKNFKKIIRIALANGWLKTDPFSNIKFRLVEVDMDFLSEEELKELMNRELKFERLQQVKDTYLFCCFTGLAFVDVKSLVYHDIEDRQGKLWIKKKR